MNDLLEKVDYFLNIAEKLSKDVYSYTCFDELERYKIGEFILLKSLKVLGLSVSEYNLPNIRRCKDNYSISELSNCAKTFKNINDELIEKILISLGWSFKSFDVENNDILDSCEFDDDGIVRFYAEEIFNVHSASLIFLMENISEITNNTNGTVTKHYLIGNQRIGKYLSKPQCIDYQIRIRIERCINELQNLLFSTYCLDYALLDNNIFVIGYFFYDDYTNGQGINTENYNMSFLIICCLINILLEEIEK